MKKPLLMGLLAFAVLGAAHAANVFPLPGKPIHFIVPYPPGGPTELMARILQAELQKRPGVPVLIENKAGAVAD